MQHAVFGSPQDSLTSLQPSDMLLGQIVPFEVEMWLGVWEKNLSALKFYQRQGFVVFGSHKFNLGDEEQNDYLMKKDL
jgi:ribosomal protein S18 acetylase RimI-like enzyme